MFPYGEEAPDPCNPCKREFWKCYLIADGVAKRCATCARRKVRCNLATRARAEKGPKAGTNTGDAPKGKEKAVVTGGNEQPRFTGKLRKMTPVAAGGPGEYRGMYDTLVLYLLTIMKAS